MDMSKRFEDIASYIKEVTDIIWKYIGNMESYPKNAWLAIQPELMATVIDVKEACRRCEFYPLSQVIDKAADGVLTPNALAIERIAEKYYPEHLYLK